MSSLAWVLCLLYIGACTFELIPFEIWPSVREYLGSLDPHQYFRKTPEQIFCRPWGIRTGIAIPSLLLGEYTPLSQRQAFGLHCGLCIVITATIVNRTAITIFRTDGRRHEVAVLLVFFALGYLMNGRLCSAFVGSALMMHAHVGWFENKLSWQRGLLTTFLALVFMTVSSGTFLVGCLTAGVWLLFVVFDLKTLARRPRFQVAVVMAAIPAITLACFQASLFMAKLSSFYDGEASMALSHGYGQFFHNYLPTSDLSYLVLLVAVTAPSALLVGFLLGEKLSWCKLYLLAAVTMSLVCGACGYSTLLTNTPTMMLCQAIVLATPRVVSAAGRRPTGLASR